MWDKVSQGPSKSWTHWPNPFPFLRDLQVVACEDRVQIRLWFWGAVFGRWFFSNFIPSPVELTRKVISGGYKCGFFLPDRVNELGDIKQKQLGSPLDFIWADRSVSQAVLEMSSPFTTTLFYLWAFQTAWSGMSAAHHALIAIESCAALKNEVLLGTGSGDWNFSPESGSPVGFTTYYDPLGRYDGISSITFPAGAISGFACGYVQSLGKNVTSCEIYIRSAVYTGPKVQLAPMAPGDVKGFALDFGVQSTLTQDYEIRMDVVQTPTFGPRLGLIVERFTMTYNKVHPTNPTPLKVPDPCKSQFLSLMNWQGTASNFP